MKVALTLTGDPIHNGHTFLLREAAKIGDHITIYMPINPTKEPTMSLEARTALMESVVLGEDIPLMNVTIKPLRAGYTAEVARRDGISYLVRGLRGTKDFDYEAELDHANTVDLNGVRTLFLMAPPQYQNLSSSYIRKMIAGHQVGWHWQLKDKVPAVVYKDMLIAYLAKEWRSLWTYRHNDAPAEFHQLLRMYQDPRRTYHNLDHIAHMLSEINEWEQETAPPVAHVRTLKLAAWFHDAVMGFGRVQPDISYEEQSAKLWSETGVAEWESSEIEQSVADLIRATDHFQTNNICHELKDVMLSVDLAILGQKRSVYENYIAGIRKEYQVFSDEQYYRGRAQALKRLLNNDKLFNDEYFNPKYEDDARSNLSRELEHLESHINKAM